MNEYDLWQVVLTEIEPQISKANFVTWFKNTYISSKKDGVVSVAVPNAFSREWLENKYTKPIMRSLRNTSRDIREIRYIIENKKPTIITAQNQTVEKRDIEETQLQFEELQIDSVTNLNPKYSFDNFVVGSSNELAHAAAISITKKPGALYNPLFIYGGVGLGKTHLLQAIGNTFAQTRKKVLYITSERFTSEFITSISNQTIDSFKNKYRNKDVLIIDDIQFIAGKEQTQEEFFHTFNTLHETNKQIILSSDRTQRSIPTLEERLRSRFEGGVNWAIPSQKHNKNETNQEQAKKILSQKTSKPNKPISYKKIFKTVSDFYEIEEKSLLGKNRKREIVLPRQIAMFLMRSELKASYPFIGERFGGKDHTTVMYACAKIEKEVNTNHNLEQEIGLIKQQIYSD